MRLLRLRLANYRGVTAREVRFAPVGVTIVAGPNEAGKTSLVEALDLLLAFRDDSGHARVRDVQPVGRDVATEVELEAECGPYAFVYRKHFHKNRRTELELSRPRVERLVGREAHERVESILRETCDLDLWQALRVQQGVALTQPGLGTSPSLATALDAAAGGIAAGAGEESLFARAQAIHGQFFTKAGKPRDALDDAERAEAEARRARDEAEAKLRSLEDEVARAARLDESLDVESRGRSELVARAEATRRQAEAAKDLLVERDRLSHACDGARAALQAAVDARRAREQLVAACAERRREREHCAQQAAELAPVLTAARAARADADETARVAAQRLADASRARDAARGVAERARAAADVARLEAIRRELADARHAAATASDLLAKSRIDERRLLGIREAERALVGARARLDVTAPQVTLRALAAGPVRIDGADVALAPGEDRRMPVAGALSIELPGRLAVRIETGAGGAKVADAVAAAERALEERLGEAGVASVVEADQAEQARREALQQRDAFARLLRERLGGEGLGGDGPGGEGRSLAALDERIDGLRRLLGDAGAAPAADLQALAADAADADTAQRDAEAARKAADDARDAARARASELEVAAAKRAEALGNASHELERAEAGLRALRETTPDAALDEALRAASERAEAARRALSEVEARLAAEDAAGARDRAQVAAAALADTETRIGRLRSERDVLQGRLESESEQGLHGALAAASARHAHAERVLAGVRRRAAAARRLLETLGVARAEARRAYAAPLRERIERLGRYVFGADFAVELDDELAVATRVLGGVPVPFGSLSGGAREQIALLARIAAAELVARSEPGAETPPGAAGAAMPLVLDDALGYTDAQRLAELGAVLAIAGRRLQVLILTCQPERWRHVGGAHEVRL